MLINEIYIGNMVQGKYGSISYKTKINKPRPRSQWYIVEGTHEPIIDRELWDRVQVLVKERAKPFDTGEVGLFARKVRCAYCGYTMRSTKNATGLRAFKCSNRHVSRDSCIGSYISLNRLEGYILKELNRLASEYLDKDEAEQNIEFCNNLKEQKSILSSDIEIYQKKLEDCTKGLRDIYLDKVKGIISEADFIDLSKNFSSEKERLSHIIAENEKKLLEIDDKILLGDNRREIIESYANLDHLNREIVDLLIDHIKVYRRIPGTKEVPIEIHWNF